MKNQYRWVMGAVLWMTLTVWTGAAHAEDAPVAPAAPAAASAAPAEDNLDNLDNLEFASGETTSFDAATGKLQVKVYLDDAGNPAENTIDLTVDSETEITNGEKDLDSSALKTGVEIDVEYDKTNRKATYVFVY